MFLHFQAGRNVQILWNYVSRQVGIQRGLPGVEDDLPEILDAAGVVVLHLCHSV